MQTSNPSNSCWFCNQPGDKVRVQITAWKYVCIHICRACRPRFNEAVTAVREEHHAVA